ncbi:hypothetical protein MRX96_045047 [Rhipicephalus microplus]
MSGGIPYGRDVPLATQVPTEQRQWTSELHVTLSCASIAFGLVSAWRLPALLYENGSFLLAYSVLLLVLGYPLLYLKLVLWHYTHFGPGALTRCLPIAKGVEVSIALVCVCAAASMGAVMAEAVLHLLLALSELPPRWAGCQGFWENKPLETCFRPGSRRLCTKGEVAKGCVNVTESVNEHFFHTSLGMASGNDEAGVRPELLGCLAAAWIIVWAELRRHSPPSAQVLPVAMIALLTLGTAWLVGAGRGLLYLFLPRLTDIVKPVLWSRAAEQVLLALGLAHGPALATLLESALTHWVDTFPNMVSQKPALAMAHCAVGFMAGLPLVSRQAGLQLLHLVNAQVLGSLLAYTAFCEVAAVSWFYGACIAAWVLIGVRVVQVPLWAAKAAASVNRSMTSRCLVPSSLMELHQLSASDGGPAVETLHP